MSQAGLLGSSFALMVFLTSTTLLGCDDPPAQPAESGTDESPGEPFVEEPPSEADQDEQTEDKADPATAECRSLLDEMWKHAATVLTAAGVDGVPDLRDEYIQRGQQGFVPRCAEHLDDQQRTCLSDADNPLAALASCEIHEMAPRVRPNAPDIHEYTEFQPRPIADADARQVLRRLIGTWQAEHDGEVTTKVITDGGTAERTLVRRSGDTTESTGTLVFRDHYQYGFDHGTGTTNWTVFFMPNDDEFFASQNRLYRVYPTPEPSAFVVQHDRNIVIYEESQGCQFFSGQGAPIEDGECGFKELDDGQVFTFQYNHPTRTRPSGEPVQLQGQYALLADHLVDQRMRHFHRQ